MMLVWVMENLRWLLVAHSMSYCFPIGRQSEDHAKRRASEPVNPIYDYPRDYLRQSQRETLHKKTASVWVLIIVYVTVCCSDSLHFIISSYNLPKIKNSSSLVLLCSNNIRILFFCLLFVDMNRWWELDKMHKWLRKCKFDLQSDRSLTKMFLSDDK